MKRFFVPYTGSEPAAVTVNGHRLVILSSVSAPLGDDLVALGADSARPVYSGDSAQEETRVLNNLAKLTNAGVVVAPADVQVRDVIRNLESQLPWLQ